MKEKLPPEITNFQEEEFPDKNKQRRLENENFEELQFKDYKHRIWSRLWVLIGVGLLLFG